MDELHFDGDPETDSTRRRLERVLKQQDRPRWPWFTAAAAGGTFLFWQFRRRRQSQSNQRSDERKEKDLDGGS
jgi:hypothetical protein